MEDIHAREHSRQAARLEPREDVGEQAGRSCVRREGQRPPAPVAGPEGSTKLGLDKTPPSCYS